LKRFMTLFLSFVMLFSLCPLSVWAEEAISETLTFTYTPDEPSDVSNDELYAAYVQRTFDESLGIETPSFYRTRPFTEGTPEWELYNGLKAELAKIAAGTRTSAEIRVSVTTSWTPESLGVSTFFSGDTLSSETSNAIQEKLTLVYTHLLMDCPLELYWHDKPFGFMLFLDGGLKIPQENLLTRDALTFDAANYCFFVAKDYSASGATETFTTDPVKPAAAANAVAKAQKIVEANAAKNNEDKLEAYRKAICDLVSYDSSAAASSPSTVGINPWQMVYVFDENPATNVVCEGYSKAFQYLCDLSTFTGNVECHTVLGMTETPSVSGFHMWNVVTMEDGRNYLVDVTNCDSGTIGADDLLFLAHTDNSADAAQVHTFSVNGSSVKYTYHTDMKDLFCDGYLPLSPVAYGAQLQTPTVTLSGPAMGYSGKEVTLTLTVSGSSIFGIEATLDYDGDALEYRSYSSKLDNWTLVNNSGNFVLYNANAPLNESTDVLTVTFLVKDTVAHQTPLAASFKNIRLSDGQKDLAVAPAEWTGTAVAAGEVVKGDVTLDGEVDADDLTALARHVAKIETLDAASALANADVDDNGTLSADDLTKLARYVAKIISSL